MRLPSLDSIGYWHTKLGESDMITIEQLSTIITRYGQNLHVREPSDLGNPDNKSFTLIKAEWDNWRKHTQTSPDYKKDSITFEKCIDAYLKNGDDGGVFLIVIVWDGDNMYGVKTDKRCTFTFAVNEVTQQIHDRAMGAVDLIAHRMAEEKEEERLRKLFDDSKSEFLELISGVAYGND
jgi:hypothetical protein